MNNQTLDNIVLRVLSVQAPGYLTHSTSSAFIAADLSADQVTASLTRLEAAGHVEEREQRDVVYYEAGSPILDIDGAPVLDANDEPTFHGDADPVTDAGGDPVTVLVDKGWVLTSTGEALVDAVPALDDLVQIKPLPTVTDYAAAEREKRVTAAVRRIQASNLAGPVKDTLTEIIRDIAP